MNTMYVKPERMAKRIERMGGEQITYVALNKVPRKIWAVVERGLPGQIAETPRGFGKHIKVSLINDATYGIPPDRLNTGGDYLMIPERIGQAATQFMLTQPPETQDEGMLTFIVGGA